MSPGGAGRTRGPRVRAEKKGLMAEKGGFRLNLTHGPLVSCLTLSHAGELHCPPHGIGHEGHLVSPDKGPSLPTVSLPSRDPGSGRTVPGTGTKGKLFPGQSPELV